MRLTRAQCGWYRRVENLARKGAGNRVHRKFKLRDASIKASQQLFSLSATALTQLFSLSSLPHPIFVHLSSPHRYPSLQNVHSRSCVSPARLVFFRRPYQLGCKRRRQPLVQWSSRRVRRCPWILDRSLRHLSSQRKFDRCTDRPR